MKFLTVLVVVFFYRNWQGDNPVQRALPVEPLFGWVRSIGLPPIASFVLFVLGPSLFVFWLAAVLDHVLFGLLWFALSLLMLVYSINIMDGEVMFDEQIIWLRSVTDDDPLSEVVQQQEDFQVSHVYEIFQGIAPALFWFLILGPAGPLLYTLVVRYLDRLDNEDPEVDFVDQCLHILEWIPTRITGLLFTLVGNFGPGFDYWLRSVTDWDGSNVSHLATMAAVSVEGEDLDASGETTTDFARLAERHVNALRALCDRATYGWLGIAALVVILNG